MYVVDEVFTYSSGVLQGLSDCECSHSLGVQVRRGARNATSMLSRLQGTLTALLIPCVASWRPAVLPGLAIQRSCMEPIAPWRMAMLPRSKAQGRRLDTCVMLAKNRFKGGNLDDFIKAGDVESKYGPQRYAARYDDVRKLEVSRAAQEIEREQSNRVYAALKAQLLADHVFLSVIGAALVWSIFDLFSVRSYLIGAALGGLYLVLSQRTADSFGATSLDEVKGGPPPLIVPVIMVGLVAKNPQQIGLLPVFAGFATERLAVLAQALYPSDFGLTDNDSTL